MLAKRIIPCLDIRNGQTVKGINFVHIPEVGDPVELGAKYAADKDGKASLHFTVSPEHQPGFEALLAEIKDKYEELLGVEFDVTFSQQKPSLRLVYQTPTLVAVKLDRLNSQPTWRYCVKYAEVLNNQELLSFQIIEFRNSDSTIVINNLLTRCVFIKNKIIQCIFVGFKTDIFIAM